MASRCAWPTCQQCRKLLYTPNYILFLLQLFELDVTNCQTDLDYLVSMRQVPVEQPQWLHGPYQTKHCTVKGNSYAIHKESYQTCYQSSQYSMMDSNFP